MVFIINGYLGSGKDTFVEMVTTQWKQMQEKQNFIFKREIINISTIDYLKDIFKEQFNWSGEKTKEARIALATIHQALSHWNDIPFVLTSKKIKQEHSKDNIVFVHCREPENIFKYSCAFNAPTIFIKNDKAKQIVMNFPDKFSFADKNVENYKYNIYINNNGSFEDLEKEANKFIMDQIIGI